MRLHVFLFLFFFFPPRSDDVREVASAAVALANHGEHLTRRPAQTRWLLLLLLLRFLLFFLLLCADSRSFLRLS